MSYKPNLNQPPSFYFPQNRSFLNETEIQEIRNDDARKLKVYGPPMSLPKPLDLPIPGLSAPISPDLFNMPILSHPYSAIGKPPQLNYPIAQTLSQTLLALQQQYPNYPNLTPFKTKPKKSTVESKKPSTSNNFDAKSNALSKNLHPIDQSPKQQNVQSLLPCKIPPSLSITLTNDDGEMSSRPMFNHNINNSIEIVKLVESGNETNAQMAKFPSPSSSSSSSSSVEKLWQAANKNANNQMKQQQQNNQIDSTYQQKFMQSLESGKLLNSPKMQKPTQQLQSIRTNLNPIDRKREPQKRRPQPDEKNNDAKQRKLQMPSIPQQQKSTPTTQRPVPDLLSPRDDKKVSVTNSSSSTSAQTSASRTNATAAMAPTTNNSNSSSEDRRSPTVTSNVSSTDKATTNVTVQAKVQPAANEIPTSKYLPLQTSSMPIWANHCTADQMASHKALVDKITQSKKNSYVD